MSYNKTHLAIVDDSISHVWLHYMLDFFTLNTDKTQSVIECLRRNEHKSDFYVGEILHKFEDEVVYKDDDPLYVTDEHEFAYAIERYLLACDENDLKVITTVFYVLGKHKTDVVVIHETGITINGAPVSLQYYINTYFWEQAIKRFDGSNP